MARAKAEMPRLNPTELMALDNAIEEAVLSHERAYNEKLLRDDIKARMVEELAVPASFFESLTKERYESKSTALLEKHTQIIELNDQLRSTSERVKASGVEATEEQRNAILNPHGADIE